MKLAFQSIGVVYGDLGTSPLYVLSGVFPNGIKHNDNILGVLSLNYLLLPHFNYFDQIRFHCSGCQR